MKLYARDSNKRIREWSINQIENSNDAVIRSGLMDGEKVQTIINHPKIRNEIASRITRKRREGYVSLKDLGIFDTKDINCKSILEEKLPRFNTDMDNNLKPMKCQKFKEGKVEYPAFAQPKLNGLRCVLRWEEYETGEGLFKEKTELAIFRGKSGLEYYLPHLTSKLYKELFSYEGRELVFDGELYIHNSALNIIKSSCPTYNSFGTLSVPSGNPEQVEFHIFDLSIPDATQELRINILENVKSKIEEVRGFRVVPSFIIHSDEEARRYRDNFISQGFEGTVIREMRHEYHFGFRPYFIRKYKKYLDSEFLIVDIISKPADPSLPLFVLKNDLNDENFECNPIGDYDWQRSILREKEDYIGLYATVKYMERSGVKQVPFHANVIDIRHNKL